MDAAPRVWVFFYGSYINLEVLAEVDLVPRESEVASLAGFDLVVRPLANLVRSDRHTVWGLNVAATHAELERLYEHARDALGGSYWPEAVVTRTRTDLLRPALTYLAHDTPEAPADPAYVQRIAGPARRLGFPDWYVERIEAFAD